MDIEGPLHSECTVSGVMCNVLYVSRIFGLAPLTFENVPNGKRIRVSRAFNIYSQVFAIVTVSLSMTGLIADLSLNKAHSRTSTNSALFLWISDLVMINLVALTCVYSGINRMQQLIVCMAGLKIVNKELNNYNQMSCIDNNKKIRLFIYFIIFFGIIVFIEYTIVLIDVIQSDGNVWAASLYIGHSIMIYILKTFVVQFSLIAMSVLPSLQAVNGCLQKIYKDTLQPDLITQAKTHKIKPYKLFHRVKDAPTINKTKDEILKLETTFDRLPLLYCELCDVVRRINDCNGLILVLVFLSFLLHLVITLYNLIMGLITDHEFADYDNAPLQLSWAFYHFSTLLLIVEPCHRTHEQMKLTKNLVNKMRHYSLRDDFILANKLKMFYRHIMLNQVTYSPMQLFVINRTIIAMIMGSITTYLVIVIQL